MLELLPLQSAQTPYSPMILLILPTVEPVTRSAGATDDICLTYERILSLSNGANNVLAMQTVTPYLAIIL